MRLGGGAVEKVDAARLGDDEGLQEALPQPAARPTMEAIVDGGRRSVDRGTILPAATDPQDVDDAAQDTSIIDPPRTRSTARQQRLDDCPLPIAEPELACHHSSSTVHELESRNYQHVNVLIGFGA